MLATNIQVLLKRYLVLFSVSIGVLFAQLKPVSASAIMCLNFYTPSGQITLSDYIGDLPKLDVLDFFSFRSPHSTNVSVIDLAKVPPGSFIEQAVRAYFLHTKKTYQDRLEKFSDSQQLKSVPQMLEIDRALMSRSILILDTPQFISQYDPFFLGGIRITLSKSLEEKLPFQYDIPDFNRPHKSGTSIEVGRLVAHSTLSRSISIYLVKTAIRVALQTPNVKDFYVHTSKVHARLYRLMGLTPSDTYIKDDLNYVLRFSVEDAIRFLKTQS